MPKQPAFPGPGGTMKTKVTQRKQFRSEMGAEAPWGHGSAPIESCHPKIGPTTEHPPIPLETMPGVWLLHSRYGPGGLIAARINRIIVMARTGCDHLFRIIKHRFGQVKTRYRNLARNRARLYSLFALGNLCPARRRRMA